LKTLCGIIGGAVLLYGVWLLGMNYVGHERNQELEVMRAEGFDAKVDIVYVPSSGVGGREVSCEVMVKNIGTIAWEPKGKDGSATALGQFEQSAVNRMVNREGHGNQPQGRAPLTNSFPVGAVRQMSLTFIAPVQPGIHHMRLQMVNEKEKSGTHDAEAGRWFGNTITFDFVVPDGVSAAAKG